MSGRPAYFAALVPGCPVIVDTPEFPARRGVVTRALIWDCGEAVSTVALDCRPDRPEGFVFTADCVWPIASHTPALTESELRQRDIDSAADALINACDPNTKPGYWRMCADRTSGRTSDIYARCAEIAGARAELSTLWREGLPVKIVNKDSTRTHPWLIRDDTVVWWVTAREAELWGFTVDESQPDGPCSITQTHAMPKPPFDRSYYWPEGIVS